MLISVIICTYNRAPILERVLSSIQAQSLSPELFELIVVDNNSADSTKKVVEEYFENMPNLRYIFEPQQGLSQARNRGWQEANGEYLAYLDDDAKAPPEWLHTAVTIINEHSPEVFGGPFYPYYDVTPPRWWKDSYQTGGIGDQTRELFENESLSGGNIFIQRRIMEEIQGFDTKLGMSGEGHAVGEETDFALRIRRVNPNALIYYHSDLFIYHLVSEEKMKFSWYFQRKFAAGQASYIISLYMGNSPYSRSFSSCQKYMKALQSLLIMVGKMTIGSVIRNRVRFPFIQNYYIERISPHAVNLGWLIESWKTLS